jgi:hypothetical protein
MSLPQLARSESIFNSDEEPCYNDEYDEWSSNFNFSKELRIEEYEEAYKKEYKKSYEEAADEELAEVAASEKQILFLSKQMDAYDDYTQLIQIVVETIKSRMTLSGFGVISIDKSVKANEYYIYMPITGNIYTIPIDHTLTFQYMLDYIMFCTADFRDMKEKNVTLEFVLDGAYQKDHVEMEITTSKFLRLPLDAVPISQGSLKILN